MKPRAYYCLSGSLSAPSGFPVHARFQANANASVSVLLRSERFLSAYPYARRTFERNAEQEGVCLRDVHVGVEYGSEKRSADSTGHCETACQPSSALSRNLLPPPVS